MRIFISMSFLAISTSGCYKINFKPSQVDSRSSPAAVEEDPQPITVNNDATPNETPTPTTSITEAPTETPSPTPPAACVNGQWTNPTNRYDVNNDGRVSPLDVLEIGNFINGPSGPGPIPPDFSSTIFLDVNSDCSINNQDWQAVVNFLNRR